ncbi:MAG: hypothetical protein MUE46_11575 [Xanthomonadales bacterium]|jgi:hypothetical protein|nr:hypothetical protein [Xanthomonadales bacterium]
MPRPLPIAAALAALLGSGGLDATEASAPLRADVLDQLRPALPARLPELLASSLPAYLYDPKQVPVGRRRPGHPAPRPHGRPDQNEGAVEAPPWDVVGEIVPVPDRWRIMEALGFKFPWYDPYNQNIWKGDKPVHDDWFLSFLAISDTVIEPRSFPIPVGPQASDRPGANDIFSGVDQTVFAQTFLGGIVYYKGDTTFRPPDWEYRITYALQYNRVDVDDVRLLTINPARGNTRDDFAFAIQELFIDRHLRDVSTRYDFDAIRFGIQPFSSDFRGFLFQDLQFGLRLFGNRDNNLKQYNLAWFRRVEKDTNSGLNDITRGLRQDDTFIANFYHQDFPVIGFTSQVVAAYNRNREDEFYFDENGFLARPALLGQQRPREYDVVYLGYNGDGHYRTYNLTTSFYLALGRNDGVFSGQRSDIEAGFFAAELSKDFDWIRPRLSLAWSSGDRDPLDNKSQGFDTIFENPIFAGADTSYWIRQTVPLVGGGGVTLSGRNGLQNSMRSSKELGQSNFDNPGLRLIGLGGDFDLTPESRVSVNLNQLWFDRTEVLELARNQGGIRKSIGTDASVAWIWRPFMSQNVIVRLSGAALVPGKGLEALYGDDDTFYSVLANIILTY